MAHCQNCDFKWSWGDMMQLSFKGKKECPNCHKNQYVSGTSSFLTTMLFTMPFVFFTSYLRAYQDAGWLTIVLIFLIYMPLISMLMPFFFRLSSTQKRFGKTVE